MEERDKLFGHLFAESNNVPSNLTKGAGTNLSALIFGNFRNLVLAEWAAIDVIVDPYTHSTTGAVIISAFADVDIAIRQAASFAAIKDLTTT